MTEVLWDCRIFDPSTAEAVERRVITLQGDTILSIDGVRGDLPEEAHDVGGATVLPGLIDAHAHVASDTTRSPGFGLGGAAALGRDDLGRVGVGCRADLVVIDGRPDEDPSVLTKPDPIRMVVGRGKVFPA